MKEKIIQFVEGGFMRGGIDVMKKYIKDLIQIALGSIILAISINIFLTPNKISAGGISSIGTVLLHLFNIKLSVTNLVLNAVLFVLGYKYLGKYSVIQTIFGILFLSAALEITSYFPTYTKNEFIAVISGGILMGIGVGLIVKIGASTGGSDFAGLILKKFLPRISLARLIMIIDCIIVIISGLIFKSFTVTFYSVAALYISSVVTDKILTVGEEAKVIYIISENYSEISDCILNNFERGVTGVKSMGMFTNNECVMLMCVTTSREISKYIKLIKETDKKSFIVIGDCHEVIGDGFKEIDIL